MLKVTLRRTVRVVPVLFLVSLATFLLVDMVPGDPAIEALGAEASEERLHAARTEMGLHQPQHERYLDWLGGVVQGDLGSSLVNPSRTVGELVLQALPVSLQIAGMGLVMALLISVPLAMWAAYREGSRVDRATLAISSGLVSVPTFLAGLLLAYFFVFVPGVAQALVLLAGGAAAWALGRAAWRNRAMLEPGRLALRLSAAAALAGAALALVTAFPDLPRTGFSRLTDSDGLGENLRTAFLPALTLALAEVAVFTRLLRADLLGTLQEDFIQSARAKGLSPTRVLWSHALRPSSFSLVTLAGVSLGRLIGGTVVVETVFGIRGMGQLIVNDGVLAGDFTVVQGGVLVVAVGYVLINLLVDLSYSFLDPRVRRG